MDALFASIEGSALSTFLRESPSLWAFPFVLILHTCGLAFLVGANVTVAARILGVAATIPLRSLERCFSVMCVGFWINASSGLLLLLAYPTKALTNPLFYVKLGIIAAGLLLSRHVRRLLTEVPHAPLAAPGRLKAFAAASLCCWISAVPAGRLLAYTCTRLMVDSPC